MTRHIPTVAETHAARRAKADLRQKSCEELIFAARLDVQEPQRGQIIERLSQMPVSCRGGYLTAMRGRSITAGVKAFCLECMGWQRSEIPECTGRACPLYPYRPWKDD